jgi:mRNA interferase RelE/StbE
MKYKIEFKPKALKDYKNIDKKTVELIFLKLDLLSDKLQGDVKKLTNFTPEYRLRVGDYRILHRKDAYK